MHCSHFSLPYLPHSHSDTLCHHTLEYIPQICIIITRTGHSLHKTMLSSAGSRRPTTQSVGLSPRSLTNSRRSVSHSATPLFLTQHDQPAWCCQIPSAVLLTIISLPGVVRYPQLCYSPSSDILSCVTHHHQPGVVRYPQLCYSPSSACLVLSDTLSCVTQHHQPAWCCQISSAVLLTIISLVLSDILSCVTHHHQPPWCCQISSAVLLTIIRYHQLRYSA